MYTLAVSKFSRNSCTADTALAPAACLSMRQRCRPSRGSCWDRLRSLRRVASEHQQVPENEFEQRGRRKCHLRRCRPMDKGPNQPMAARCSKTSPQGGSRSSTLQWHSLLDTACHNGLPSLRFLACGTGRRPTSSSRPTLTIAATYSRCMSRWGMDSRYIVVSEPMSCCTSRPSFQASAG